MAVVELSEHMYSHLSSSCLQFQKDLLERDLKFYTNLSQKLSMCSMTKPGLHHPSDSANNASLCEEKLKILKKEMESRK